MNNKLILVVILATLLALVCALFVIKKSNNELPNIEEKSQVQQEVIDFQKEVDSNVNEKEDIIEKDNVVKNINPSVMPVIKEVKQEENFEEPVLEKVVVQEGSVVEEVEDHGIRRNDDGTYEITREFKMKSPTKYSFVDFGFLEKVTK